MSTPAAWAPDVPVVDNGRPADLTWRTLADIDVSPPGDLMYGMLEPDAPSLIYGAGGTGKGTTSAWLIRQCYLSSLRALIYDAELHPGEWRRRTSGLDVPPECVTYVTPMDLPHRLQGQPLEHVVPHLGEIMDASESSILFLDSILAAANLSEEKLRSDAGAPYRYTAALAKLGKPSVSIGHTPKLSPEGDPYGSVSWVNAMRLTWLGTTAEGEGHRVRWRPRKRNERGHIPAFLLTFDYNDMGQLCGVTREDDEHATRAWLTDALSNGERTVEDLAEEFAETIEGNSTAAIASAKERIRKTLGRMRKAGHVHKTGGRGAPWALGQPDRVSRKKMRDTQ
jgi:hypothetical protein